MKNFRLVEVQTTNVSQVRFFLADDEVLRAKTIKGVEAYRAANVSNVPGSGRALASAGTFAKAFLVLVSPDGKEIIYKLPLVDLDRSLNNGVILPLNLPPIAPSKCYIEVATVAGLSAAESFLLGFHYEN